MGNQSQFNYEKSCKEILQTSGLGLLILDEKRDISWCNAIFSDWLGQSLNNIAGESFVTLPFESCDENSLYYRLFSKKRKESMTLHHWNTPLTSRPEYAIHYFLPIPTIPANQDESSSNEPQQKPSWAQFLDYEVSRSRRYDNPLSLIKLKMIVFEQNGHLETDNMQKLQILVSQILKDEMRWADMLGQSESGDFLVVLPETPEDALSSLIQKVIKTLKTQINNQFPDIEYDLAIGYASWKKGDNSRTMLDRARSNLIDKLSELQKHHQS